MAGTALFSDFLDFGALTRKEAVSAFKKGSNARADLALGPSGERPAALGAPGRDARWVFCDYRRKIAHFRALIDRPPREMVSRGAHDGTKRMFEGLSEKLSGIFDALTRRGSLSEEDVNVALREVRRALLEADVALDVVRSFVDKVRSRAVGANVIKSVTPGQMVVKIVNDVLIETLGAEAEPINLDAAPPVAIMVIGLQGAGKTTTTAKIAKRLSERMKRKVLMASLDVKRPAAQEQLAVLGRQIGVETLPVIAGQTPVQIAVRAEQAARLQGFDVVLLDTAGRTHIDEALMQEMAEIKAASKPHEILLVADSLTGQDAVNLAKSFDGRVGITGIVLTRVDGDGRGGAALSMRAVTGKPIKLLGAGEKMDALEDFHPSRIANRILGMGDIVSLVEKAAESIDAEKAQRIADRMRKGKFDLEDLSEQLAQVEKIGGLGGIMGMLPGMAKIKDQLAAANLDDRIIKRQRAIISSMTRQERRNPDILKASRKKRIASGSGVKVEDVNKLLKQHRQMADMMKSLGGAKRGGGALGKMASMFGMPGAGMGGMPQPSPEQIAALQKQLGPMPGGPAPKPVAAPKPLAPPPAGVSAAPKLPGLGGGAGGGLGAQPGKLPGLGGGLLSGLNPFGKKK
ncbi:Signal recognition particle protein [Methylocella tundrae]|uniref:Signal recognition particle protein n=2 Tax=Methylocella tundrae TaxID=227605 RepID=A0A8B6M8G0_METTU|nr:Signal recognition particle protein [Methylocella tundrae]VTZ50771.1 Signal recognition particle protein [Methylocella tundrae]